MTLVTRFCVKVSDDFAVDVESNVNIQEGDGCERVIARELYIGVDVIEVSSESGQDPLMSVSIS